MSEFEAIIKNDPATSYWLAEQLELSKQRDVLDALHDAEALVKVLQGRLLDLLQQ